MYQHYIICSNGRERKNKPFYVTFVVQNHQLNQLPPADLKMLLMGFVRVFSALYRKIKSRNSYRFFNLAARKVPAHTHTYKHTFIEIYLWYVPAALELEYPFSDEQDLQCKMKLKLDQTILFSAKFTDYWR